MNQKTLFDGISSKPHNQKRVAEKERSRRRRADDPEKFLIASKRWNKANPEKRKKAASDYRARHPVKVRETKQKWFSIDRKKNPEKYKRKGRSVHLKRRYSLTMEAEQEMIQTQAGNCLICGTSLFDSLRAIDHDHNTGRVRGILCRKCNSAIGMLRDSPSLLMRARSYLIHHLPSLPPQERYFHSSTSRVALGDTAFEGMPI